MYAFSVYLLRRLEIRFLKLAYEDNEDEKKNILIIDKKYNPSVVIFNEYKTAKVFKKQVLNIPDEIKALVKQYLIVNDINIGDYVFGLKRNKKEYISQGNFSTKIKTVFNKLYDDLVDNKCLKPYKNKFIMELLKGLHYITFTSVGLQDPLFFIIHYCVNIFNFFGGKNSWENPYENSLFYSFFILWFIIT